jgi:glycosyltransferase involved in cell wall biosynthesis
MYEFAEIILAELDSLPESKVKIYFIIHHLIFDFLLKKYGLAYIEECSSKNIIIEKIPLYTFESLNRDNLIISSFKEEKYLQKLIYEKSINKILLLQLDLLQLCLGIKYFINKKNIIIHGILLTPFNVIPKAQRIYRIRKYFLLKILLLNKCIDKIFIFNDLATVNELKTIMNDNRFFLLQDPIRYNPKYQSLEILPIRHSIHHQYILSIGGISYRKNIHNVLLALNLLSDETLKSIKFIVSGVVHDKNYESYLDSLVNDRIKNSVIFIKRLLTSEEIDYLLSISNVVMAAYINFFYSSGVVGNAAKFCKPVICSNQGLMANIVKAYGIGFLVNPNSPNEISNAILNSIYNNNVKSNGKFTQYINDNHYTKFAYNLLKDLVN